MKPVVRYTDANTPVIGERCFLVTVDHYSSLVSNTTTALTSPVVAFNSETGEIETQNTIYKKVSAE